MSRRDLIDPDVREPLDHLLEAIPGGFNTIPDIVQRRAVTSQLLAALEMLARDRGGRHRAGRHRAGRSPARPPRSRSPVQLINPWSQDFRHYHGKARPASMVIAGYFPSWRFPHGYQAP